MKLLGDAGAQQQLPFYLFVGWRFAGYLVRKLRVLLNALLFVKASLSHVECVRPKQTGDLFLKLRKVSDLKGVLQGLNAEQQNRLIEELVCLLIRQNLRFKLHERMALRCSLV